MGRCEALVRKRQREREHREKRKRNTASSAETEVSRRSVKGGTEWFGYPLREILVQPEKGGLGNEFELGAENEFCGGESDGQKVENMERTRCKV